MIIPSKALKNNFRLPIFGIGTWQMGGKKSRDITNDDQADIRAIQAAIELGVTHIDTAENYAAGFAELIVGTAIKPYRRENLFLVSKVAPEHLAYNDLIHSATRSLERLGTNYIDLYLLHAPNPNIPIQETMKAMDYLKNKGLIRNIGVSNFTVERFKHAQSYTKNKIVANQLHFNLQYREVETKGLLQYCQENDVMLIAWRPLQKGSLLKDTPVLVDKLAQKYQKTPAQVAINWLLSQENVVTVVKARDINHLKENLGAIGWTMEKEDIEQLRKEYPNQQQISDAVPLI